MRRGTRSRAGASSTASAVRRGSRGVPLERDRARTARSPSSASAASRRASRTRRRRGEVRDAAHARALRRQPSSTFGCSSTWTATQTGRDTYGEFARAACVNSEISPADLPEENPGLCGGVAGPGDRRGPPARNARQHLTVDDAFTNCSRHFSSQSRTLAATAESAGRPNTSHSISAATTWSRVLSMSSGVSPGISVAEREVGQPVLAGEIHGVVAGFDDSAHARSASRSCCAQKACAPSSERSAGSSAGRGAPPQ